MTVNKKLLKVEDFTPMGMGVAKENNKINFIPFSTIGDELYVVEQKHNKNYVFCKVDEVVSRGDSYKEPHCIHYGNCGGCLMMHFEDNAYKKQKIMNLNKLFSGFIKDAFNENNVVFVPKCEQSKRVRTTLNFNNCSKTGFKLGYHNYHSEEIESIKNCLILAEEINVLIAKLPSLLSIFGAGKIFLTKVNNGIDIGLETQKEPNSHQLKQIAIFAKDNNIMKVSWRETEISIPQIVYQIEEPQIIIANYSLNLPKFSFLQPSHLAMEILANEVVDFMPKTKNVLELFSGLGTLTLSIAKNHKVHAVDIMGEAIKSLQKTADSTKNNLKVTTETRNLFNNPFSAPELSKFSTVVMNPPRAGAQLQCEVIAKGLSIYRPQYILYVSCHPTALLRDMKILIQAGYEISGLKALDQFIYSSHIEVIVLFKLQKDNLVAKKLLG